MTKVDEKYHTPLYQGIYDKLRQSIDKGTYRTGDRLPSERQLSKSLGVCHLTVRKALARLVDEGLIHRRSGSGTVVIAGRPGKSVPHPVTSLSIILDEVDDFTSRIITRLETACRKRAMRLSIYCHDRDPNQQAQQYRRAAQVREALIVLLPFAPTPDLFADKSAARRTIIADDHVPGLDAPQIMSDDVEGTFMATKYLADLGHRVIGHIASDTKTTGANRRRGFRKAVKALGLATDETLIQNGSFLLEPSHFAGERIFDHHPDVTALVCANDYAAFGAMKSLKKRGLVPGVNFSLTGYGNYDISEPLGLTSVDQCIDPLCDQILFFVDEYANGTPLAPSLCLIPTDLKVRGSCVKIR